MEEPVEDPGVAPELYFLIAKFLSSGPLQETAKTLLRELGRVEVLPKRLDWTGAEHSQTYDELVSRYSDVSGPRLLHVCSRALRLAAGSRAALGHARLSLLGDYMVRRRPARDSRDPRGLPACLHERELGNAHAYYGPFPSRMLADLRLLSRGIAHASAAYCAAWDRTGRYVLTGADDFLVKLWRYRDGEAVRAFRGATGEITDLSVSSDNRLVAAGAVDRCVRIWSLQTGRVLASLAAHSGAVTVVAWRPGCHELATAGACGGVALWHEASDWSGIRLSSRGRGSAACAAWSAGGLLLAAGGPYGRVRVWRGARLVLAARGGGGAVDSLRWAHAGLRFAAGSRAGGAAVWGAGQGGWRRTRLAVPGGARPRVSMVCWDLSDTYVLAALADGHIAQWTAQGGPMLGRLRTHGAGVFVLEAHPTLPYIVLSAGHDGRLAVWDVEVPTPLTVVSASGALYDAKWSPEGGAAAAVGAAGELLLLGLGDDHRVLGGDIDFYLSLQLEHLMGPSSPADEDEPPPRPEPAAVVGGALRTLHAATARALKQEELDYSKQRHQTAQVVQTPGSASPSPPPPQSPEVLQEEPVPEQTDDESDGCSSSSSWSSSDSSRSESGSRTRLRRRQNQRSELPIPLPEWIGGVLPRKAPYQPQPGDTCMYFRAAHQRYLEAQPDPPRAPPADLAEYERVMVVGVRYSIRYPDCNLTPGVRLAALRLRRLADAGTGRLTLLYHDVPGVIDFLVLLQHYQTGTQRGWAPGMRFRCAIDDCWWAGTVSAVSPAGSPAAHFLSLAVLWDGGERDRLSPWDLEPCASPDRNGAPRPVAAPELAALYAPLPQEWGGAERAEVAAVVAEHLSAVMALPTAQAFVVAAPEYRQKVAYPVDLTMIRSRFINHYYRRLKAALFDAKHIASGAEQFYPQQAEEVRHAKVIADLLAHIITNWQNVDIQAKYTDLTSRTSASPGWPAACRLVLRRVRAHADAAPFLRAVPPEQAPDYRSVIRRPVHLNLVRRRLRNNHYSSPDAFCSDMRSIFSNSRVYNTDRRSQIYAMTVALSQRFERLWSESGLSSVPAARKRTRPVRLPDHQESDTESSSGPPRGSKLRREEQSASTDDEYEPDTTRRQYTRRPREPASSQSSTSSSASAVFSGLSDDDDDRPLTSLRARQRRRSSSASDVAGPSSGRGGRTRGARPARTAPRSTDDDSDEALANTRQRQIRTHADHTYHNGHARHARPRISSSSSHDEIPLSVSSRGRVRRLTAKAKGLLRD